MTDDTVCQVSIVPFAVVSLVTYRKLFCGEMLGQKCSTRICGKAAKQHFIFPLLSYYRNSKQRQTSITVLKKDTLKFFKAPKDLSVLGTKYVSKVRNSTPPPHPAPAIWSLFKSFKSLASLIFCKN